MKRIIAAMILSTTIFCATPVTAEQIDFSSYSVNELLAIRDQVDEALYSQGGKTILPFGEYVVGRDIAAGSYTISPHNEDSEEQWNSAWQLRVYKTVGDKEKYEIAAHEYERAYWDAYDTKDSDNPLPYPVDLSTSVYMSLDKDVSTDEQVTVSLEEGQLMVINRTHSDTVELTIEKKSGLFME